MKNNFFRKNIIEIICTFYIFMSIIIFFLLRNINEPQKALINDFLDGYLWGEIGIYSRMEPLYSKLVVNILATLTPIFILVFFSFRKHRNHPRKIGTPFHYAINICLIPILYLYLWGDSWQLISDPKYSLLREMINFNIIVCPLYGFFISESWYFFDMLEKIYVRLIRK
ncbi:hypothetical protein A1D29_01885 [Pasteurellaceae bacterium Orientalotternb1]|nr:hypothetical protein A1D29_01885 [Pasteurellaceae bacterium Orientalotternb1]